MKAKPKAKPVQPQAPIKPPSRAALGKSLMQLNGLLKKKGS